MTSNPVRRIIAGAVLIAVLFTALPIPGGLTPASAKTSSCSLVISSLHNQFNFLRHLEESYEQSMYFANNDFHREYREEHLDNAESALSLIASTVEHIGTLLDRLGSCSGLGNYSYEELEQILRNILLQLSTPFYDRDIGLQQYGFDQQYARMIRNIKRLEEHDDFNKLYRDLVLGDPKIRQTTERYIDNLLAGWADRTFYRIPSYQEDAAAISNLSIIMDGFLLAKQHIEGYMDNLRSLSLDPKFYQNQMAKMKAAGANTIKSITLDNVKTMGLRAMYKTAIEQQMVYPNMDPTQKAFSEDFAGNLASFMISTDYISFAISYSEMVGDLYHYINQQVGQVFDKAKEDVNEYERLKQDVRNKEQLFVKVNNFAQDIGRLKMDEKVTEAQYVRRFDTAYNRLIADVKDIYKTDPNEIKIYLNGKLLQIPEKAYIIDGTTMVPLRVITEEMNVKPVWNQKDKSITITTTKNMLSLGKPMEVVFTIGSKQVQLGKYYTSIPAAPVTKNGITFVPLSFIAQNLGLRVEWVGASSSVVLTSI